MVQQDLEDIKKENNLPPAYLKQIEKRARSMLTTAIIVWTCPSNEESLGSNYYYKKKERKLMSNFSGMMVLIVIKIMINTGASTT